MLLEKINNKRGKLTEWINIHVITLFKSKSKIRTIRGKNGQMLSIEKKTEWLKK